MLQTTPSRPNKPLPKSTWYRIIPTLLLLLAALWFSFTHASPLPYGDEYELTPVLAGHAPLSLTYLLSRHNEHRLPLSRLALHAVLPMVGYDFRYAAMAVPLCLGATALGLAAALARAREHWLWSDNVPALLLLSFGNAETLTWAFNLHFGFQVALSLAVLACLTPALAGAPPSFTTAAGCATALLLLPGAGMNGALMAACLWPVFVVTFLRPSTPAVRGLTLVATSLGVIELLAEFMTAPTLNGSGPGIATALQSMIAFLSVTAGPATRIAWPLIGGVVAVGFGVAAAWLTARAATARTFAMLAAPAMLVCSMLFAAAVAVNRVRGNPAEAIQDRYFLLQSVSLIAIYWAVGVSAERSAARVRWALLAIAAVIAGGNLRYGLNYADAYKSRHTVLLADMHAGMPLRTLAEKYHAHPFGLYNPSAEKLHACLDALRQGGRGPIRDAVASPPCRRVELPGTAARVDPETGHLVFAPPLNAHCIAWSWASPGADSDQPAALLCWPAGGSADSPITHASTVGHFPRRESLLLDRPIERLAFATAKDEVELRVNRIVLHVPDE
jgi:hypothetical protein